jgi:hypothetical protein
MKPKTLDEELIAQFLLGNLPEEEQVPVEERAFRDPQFAKDVMVVENDLIDEYVRGELSDRDRLQFESRFLASSKRRQKIEFARALAKVVSESKSGVTEGAAFSTAADAPSSWWDAFVAFWRGPHLAFKVSATAAALMLVTSLSWLVTENLRLRAQLAQHQEASTREVAETRARSEDLNAQLQREREHRQRNEELLRKLQQERLGPDPKESRQPLSALASLVLWPGTARSGGERPQLIVPQAARQAQLQIGLEGKPEYRQFRVELRTRGGKEVWSQERLSARRSRVGWAVVVSLPTRALASGEYELALKGVGDEQKLEDVGYYYFSVLQE